MNPQKMICALVNVALPEEGEPFSLPDRRRFFEALEANLDVLYGSVGELVKPKANQ